MTTIEQLAAEQSRNAELAASVAELTAKLSASTSALTAFADTSASLVALRDEHAANVSALEAVRAELASVTVERDEVKAALEKIKAERALTPAAFNDVSNGREPLASGTGDGDAKDAATCQKEYKALKSARERADYRARYAKQLGLAK